MRVIVDMPDELVKRLDAMAARMERPRSWLIRHLCDYGLTHNETVVRSNERVTLTVPRPTAGSLRLMDVCAVFTPQKGNKLRCDKCGYNARDHE